MKNMFWLKVINRGIFQQAAPFLETSEQSDLKPENRDHFYILFYSVIPSFYTPL